MSNGEKVEEETHSLIFLRLSIPIRRRVITAIILVVSALIILSIPPWWFTAEGNFEYSYSIKPGLLRDWFSKDWLEPGSRTLYGIREENLRGVNLDLQESGAMTFRVWLDVKNESILIHDEHCSPFHPPSFLIPLETILYHLERLGFKEGNFTLEYRVSILLFSVHVPHPEMGDASLPNLVDHTLARVFMTAENRSRMEPDSGIYLSISSVESHPLELTLKVPRMYNPILVNVKIYVPLLLLAAVILLQMMTMAMIMKTLGKDHRGKQKDFT